MQQILVAFNAWGGAERAAARGIARYAADHHLRVGLSEGGPPLSTGRRFAGYDVLGCIVEVASEQQRAAADATAFTVVNLTAFPWAAGLPSVVQDFEEAGRRAAAYFLDAGYRQLAVLRARAHEPALDAFAAAVDAAGVACQSLDTTGGVEERRARIAATLRRLPKPMAVFAGNDRFAHRAVGAVLSAGLSVPDDVAVLGVGDDETFCSLSYPPLSSVPLNTERQGYEAAALLHAIASGDPPPDQPVRIKPGEVVVRGSTDTVATRDPDVAKALSYIRDHHDQPLRVADILDAVPLSRSTLERRFKELLGRTPSQEIRRAHVARAKRLLSQTDWPLQRVAFDSGFATYQHFANTFRQETGVSPGAFRTQTCSP